MSRFKKKLNVLKIGMKIEKSFVDKTNYIRTEHIL